MSEVSASVAAVSDRLSWIHPARSPGVHWAPGLGPDRVHLGDGSELRQGWRCQEGSWAARPTCTHLAVPLSSSVVARLLGPTTKFPSSRVGTARIRTAKQGNVVDVDTHLIAWSSV